MSSNKLSREYLESPDGKVVLRIVGGSVTWYVTYLGPFRETVVAGLTGRPSFLSTTVTCDSNGVVLSHQEVILTCENSLWSYTANCHWAGTSFWIESYSSLINKSYTEVKLCDLDARYTTLSHNPAYRY